MNDLIVKMIHKDKNQKNFNFIGKLQKLINSDNYSSISTQKKKNRQKLPSLYPHIKNISENTKKKRKWGIV